MMGSVVANRPGAAEACQHQGQEGTPCIRVKQAFHGGRRVFTWPALEKTASQWPYNNN